MLTKPNFRATSISLGKNFLTNVSWAVFKLITLIATWSAPSFPFPIADRFLKNDWVEKISSYLWCYHSRDLNPYWQILETKSGTMSPCGLVALVVHDPLWSGFCFQKLRWVMPPNFGTQSIGLKNVVLELYTLYRDDPSSATSWNEKKIVKLTRLGRLWHRSHFQLQCQSNTQCGLGHSRVWISMTKICSFKLKKRRCSN